MSMPMRNNPYKQYQKQGVLTANPGELIVMLYDACIKNMKLAEIFVGEKNYEGANKAYIKAQDIMTELVSSLNYDYEIAEQLLRIYDFVIRQFHHVALLKNRRRLIDPILYDVFNIMHVNVAAFEDIIASLSNDVAIFDNFRPSTDITVCNFMS